MSNLITIQQAVENFKSLINSSIISGGVAGKQAMIRSSKPINNIHEAVKAELIRNGIERYRIHPPLGTSKPELKLAGFIKQKYQDVCVEPRGYSPKNELLTEGILQEETDYYGKAYTERTLSINIRSQISSLAKNFDTLYERTIAEAQNLHVRCNRMVLGEVYMIAVPEYDASAMKSNKVKFVQKSVAVEKYIKSFTAINNRSTTDKEEYKYEKACLLIVDFSQSPVKIYHNDEELISAGLLSSTSYASIESLNWQSFIPSLLNIYQERFES